MSSLTLRRISLIRFLHIGMNTSVSEPHTGVTPVQSQLPVSKHTTASCCRSSSSSAQEMSILPLTKHMRSKEEQNVTLTNSHIYVKYL